MYVGPVIRDNILDNVPIFLCGILFIRDLCIVYAVNGFFLRIYGNIPDISTILHGCRMRFAGRCCRVKHEFVSDLLFWSLSDGARQVARHAPTDTDQLCHDTKGLHNDRATLMQNLDA